MPRISRALKSFTSRTGAYILDRFEKVKPAWMASSVSKGWTDIQYKRSNEIESGQKPLLKY